MNLQPDPTLTLIQISDTHLMDIADAHFVEMNPEITFHGLMQHILDTHPKIDAIIHTGDVAQVAVPQTYARYLDYMHGLKVPFYQTPGNHDDLSIFPYPQHTPISVIEMGNWVIILLTSAVSGKVDGHIDETQLQDLEQLLQKFSHRYILIGCHHNPLLMHSQWLDQHRLKNTESLLDVLFKYPQVKAVIHGHVHQEFSETRQHIQFLATPSTCVQFKPLSQEFALDDQAPGYRLLTLSANGEISSEVFRIPALMPKINQLISGY